MRTIKIEEAVIGNVGGEDLVLSNTQLMKEALEMPKNPQAGTTLAEMRTVTPILTRIEAAEEDESDTFILEETEFSELCERLERMPLRTNSRPVMNLLENVLATEKWDA